MNTYFLKSSLVVVSFFPLWASHSQVRVFENREIKKVIEKGISHIYNTDFDSAEYYINILRPEWEDHPVVPLMDAINILWSNIPLINDAVFSDMKRHLYRAIFLAKRLDPQLNDPEFIYFSLASYGLLAEYYAENDNYMKAVGATNKAYGLLKKGFELTEENSEFLLTTGLYNYFREKYPEKFPIYKPFLWFFRSGDMDKGINQLKRATTDSFFGKVEAYIYLSYIYLRYEYQPEMALEYLEKLCSLFPHNFYAKAKWLEAMVSSGRFVSVDPAEILELISRKSPYFKLAGYVFYGYYMELVVNDLDLALSNYELGLEIGEHIPNHGEYFKSLGYLGIGRIQFNKGQLYLAEDALKIALSYAETEQIKEESKEYLSRF